MTTQTLTSTRLGRVAIALAIALATLVSPGLTERVRATPTVPHLSWTDCGDGFQCAEGAVPLDYDVPHGRSISLSLIRLPAGDPARRIGSLFINPGGPGISAVAVVRGATRIIYTSEVLARFDIVGMDPRGVGGSTPVRCHDNRDDEAAFEGGYPMFPADRQENLMATRKDRDLAHRCWSRSGWLLEHLSTANVARDMDLLRRAVGDRKLHYVGYSYGSYLGTTYANMFPDRVGSLVLDSVLDPTSYAPRSPGLLGTMPFLRQGSDVGASGTMAQFFTLCREAGPAGVPSPAPVIQRRPSPPSPTGSGFTLSTSLLRSARSGSDIPSSCPSSPISSTRRPDGPPWPTRCMRCTRATAGLSQAHCPAPGGVS
jgi:pimeloyl-ACP methyl ester carboxylesterase